VMRGRGDRVSGRGFAKYRLKKKNLKAYITSSVRCLKRNEKIHNCRIRIGRAKMVREKTGGSDAPFN